MARRNKDLQGVPDGAKLFLVGDQYHLIYEVNVPGKRVPIRLSSRIYDEKELNRIYGSKRKAQKSVTRKISERQFKSMGIFNMGTSEALQDLGNHPWVQFLEEFKKNRKIRPWLGNREMLHIALEAYAEGRQPTEAEIQGTRWYRSRNDSQRKWMETVNADPAQAEQILDDNRLRVQSWIKESGINSLNQRAVNYMVNKFTHGDWSETEVRSQILNLADYHNPGGLDDPLRRIAGGRKMRTHEHENKVRDMALEYLGPTLGKLDNRDVKNWASRFRTDADAEDQFRNLLRDQFKAQWGDVYKSAETYNQIAGPWRNLGTEILGEQVDERSDEFYRVLKANDAAMARQEFVNYGLNRGIKKVEDDSFSAMDQAFGSSVIGMEEAR